MKGILVGLVAVVMLATNVSVAAPDDVRAANRAYLLDKLGDPTAPVTANTPQGSVMSTVGAEVEKVVNMIGDRVKLADVAAGATHGGFPLAADVWIQEIVVEGFFGGGVPPACPVFNVIVDRAGHGGGTITADPQLWVYGGDTVNVVGDTIATHVPAGLFAFAQEVAIGWTTKDVLLNYNADISYTGQGNFGCFTGFGQTFNFAFMDGLVTSP